MSLTIQPARPGFCGRSETLSVTWHSLGRALLLACLFLAALPAVAIDTQASDFLNPISGLVVLRDRNAVLDFEAATSAAMQNEWQAAEGVPNFGMTRDAMWLAMAVLWPERADARWLLQIAPALTGRVDVFRFELDTIIDSERTQLSDDGAPLLASGPAQMTIAFQKLANRRDSVDVDHMVMGARFAYDKRPVSQRNFSLWLEPLPSRVQWIVIRIESSAGLRAPVELISERQYRSESGKQQLVQFAYFGLMAIIVLLSMGAFYATRDLACLAYAAFVVLTSLFMLVDKGYAFEYLWPNSPDWSIRALPVTVALACLMGALFSFSFLRLRKNAPAAFWLAMLVTVLWIPTALFAAYGDYRQALVWLGVLVPVGAATLIFAAFLCLRRGVPGAAYYCVCWVTVLIVATVMMLVETGIVTVAYTMSDILQIGFVFEFITLSLLMGSRLNRQLHERTKALQDLHAVRRKVIATQTQTRERTQELKQAMQEIAEANLELKQLSTTDDLTQLSNRRSISATLNREWSRCGRNEGSLSIIMLDLDHFKSINDKYGHPCGDEVLRTVASLLSGAVQRSGDLVGRYGGEEFIIVLAATAPRGAAVIAERIRSSIENAVIHYERLSINVTASFGIASSDPSVKKDGQGVNPMFSSSEALIDAADRALYLAKERGRNRVVVMNDETDDTASQPSSSMDAP